MAPLSPQHGNRRSAPAKRRWLLAAGGVLLVAGIGALTIPEERPHAATTQSPPHSTRSQSSPDRRFTNSVSPGGSAKEHNARDVPWSEEEQEKLRVRAQNDPPGFGRWATTVSQGSKRRFALETAALAWGAGDPSSAAAWAEDLAGESERTLALTLIAGEAVRSDPQLALELACSLPEPAMNDIVPRAAAEWAASDPAAAAEWAGQISSTPLRAASLAGIATVWSEQDAIAAATMALRELPAGRLQSDTIVSIVQRWAQQFPAEAGGWVERFPEGDLRDAALECIAQVSGGNP